MFLILGCTLDAGAPPVLLGVPSLLFRTTPLIVSGVTRGTWWNTPPSEKKKSRLYIMYVMAYGYQIKGK